MNKTNVYGYIWMETQTQMLWHQLSAVFGSYEENHLNLVYVLCS